MKLAKPKPNGMTRQQFRDLALYYSELNNKLVEASVQVSNLVGKAKARNHSNAVDRVINKLASLQLRLESLACQQYGDDTGMSLCNSFRLLDLEVL